MARWIEENARPHTPEEVVARSKKMRELGIAGLPALALVFMEAYIPKHVPTGRVVHRWFDVHDLEEGRI